MTSYKQLPRMILLGLLLSLGTIPSLLAQRGTAYQVIINHEEQYAIWPAEKPLAPGWKAVGRKGTQDKCQAYIQEVWTDMRPLSIRKQASATGKYAVIINHEEQYSVWPAGQKPPRNWKATKVQGDLAKCQAYIEEVWTDMRPLSLRQR